MNKSQEIASDLFFNLDQKWIDLLQHKARKLSLEKHQTIVTEGAETDSMYLLLSGRAKVFMSDDQGKDIILAIVTAGAYIGEVALLDGAPRTASVETLEPCELLQITRKSFVGFISEHPDHALEIIHLLTSRIRNLTANIRNLAFKNVYNRIVYLFENQAVDQGDGRKSLATPLTQQEIADMVGASREMVSRVITELVKGEYISIKSKIITINRKLPSGW